MQKCSICKKRMATYKLSYDIDGSPIYICGPICHRTLLVEIYGAVSTIECEEFCSSNN